MKLKKTCALTLLICLSSSFPGLAIDGIIEKMNLDKALKTVVENSPYLKAAGHEKNTYSTYKDEAKSHKLPTVDILSGYVKTNSPADVFGLQLSQEKFSMADFMINDPNFPSPYEDYFTTLQLSQVLYAGGQIKNGIKQGNAMEMAGNFKYERAIKQVQYNTVKAYLDVILSSQYTILMENVVNTVKAHVEQAKNYFDAGFIMEADYLQAQIILSEMERKKMSSENNSKLARAYFNNVIGVDQGTEYEFENSFQFTDYSLELNNLLEKALDSRADYKEMQYKVEASSHQINIEKSDKKPKVMFIGELNYHDNSLFGSDAQSYKVMAVAKFNVFNGKRTRSKIKRAKEQHMTYTNYRKQMEEGIKLQVKQAFYNVEDSIKQYKTAQLAEKQAKKNLTLREERYKSGVEKTTDLMTADTEYVKATTASLNSLFNYYKAIESLKFMTGIDTLN